MPQQRRGKTVLVCLAAQCAAILCGCASVEAADVPADAYDAAVLADKPVGYWTLANPFSGKENDAAGSGHEGHYGGPKATTTVLPNGTPAAHFRGDQYLEVADASDLRPATTGVLTVEAWICPDTLDFAHTEGTGYVNWLGKGEPGSYEYVSRIYSAGNDEGRANRISGYYFKLSGGLGAGSFFQDTVTPGGWIHYVLVINRSAQTDEYPNGYTKIYKNGVLRDQDDLSVDGEPISSGPGTAPLRVGTDDLESFFEGSIGKVAIYNYELSQADILGHDQLMTGQRANVNG